MSGEDPSSESAPLPGNSQEARAEDAVRRYEQEILGAVKRFEDESAGARPLMSSGWHTSIGCTMILIALGAAMGSCFTGEALWLLIVPILALVWLIMSFFVVTHYQSELASRLAEFDDVRVVGPMLRAWNWPEYEVQ